MNNPVFSIRRMSRENKPAMREIASRIWEGSDYLPGVFDEWVADSRGEFAAVFLGDRLAGCAKLTYLSDTDAWLEGLRKDPTVPVTGLGRAVSAHFLSILAARRDLTSVRLATYVRNRASIRISESLGFRLRTTLSVKAWRGSRIDLVSSMRAHASRALSRGTVDTVRDRQAIGTVWCWPRQDALLQWKMYPENGYKSDVGASPPDGGGRSPRNPVSPQAPRASRS